MHLAGLSSFVAASLVLAVAPGTGVVYIVGRTLAQGRRAGLASVAGVACGNAMNAMGAALGLAALFAVSDAAFLIVKWAGCAWLVWIGVRLLRSGWQDRCRASGGRPGWQDRYRASGGRPGGRERFRASGGQPKLSVPLPADRPSPRRLWSDGLLVALFNPKTTLFFAAFLPQFIDPMARALPQVLLLGAGFVAIAACTDVAYALLASAVVRGRSGGAGSRAIGVGRMASGAVLVVLGLVNAATGARRPV